MSNTPLVSIITPCYNAALFIERTIESVLAQSYTNWEMIIVDDASTDLSQEIITKYISKNKQIKLLVNKKNMGTAESRNVAIREAAGEYIAFLDNDDIWLPQKLSKQVLLMQEEDIFLSYSSYDTIDKSGQPIGHFPVQEKVCYSDMLKTSIIGTLTMIYNAKKLGKFYFHGVGHEDYVMKLEILKKTKFAKGINETLAKYRILNDSLSRNKIRAAKWQWHIYRDIEKLPLLKSIYYFMHYTYRGLTKYKKYRY